LARLRGVEAGLLECARHRLDLVERLGGELKLGEAGEGAGLQGAFALGRNDEARPALKKCAQALAEFPVREESAAVDLQRELLAHAVGAPPKLQHAGEADLKDALEGGGGDDVSG